MIIHTEEVPESRQDGRPLMLKRVVNIDEHSDDISGTWVRIWGHHDRVVNHISDRVYSVIAGEGRFQVGDDAPIETVRAGEFALLPKNVPYAFEGEMRYLVM